MEVIYTGKRGQFTKEEFAALQTISRIECMGLECKECPCRAKQYPAGWQCMANMARDILSQYSE